MCPLFASFFGSQRQLFDMFVTEENGRGRRRDSVGQGRGPDPADVSASSGNDLSSMQGLWVELDGGGRGLVVATGIVISTREEMLLVEMHGGGPKRMVPWRGGQPEARIIPGERRELVDVALPILGIGEEPRGTYRHGDFVDAMVRAGGRSADSISISIRRVALQGSFPSTL